MEQPPGSLDDLQPQDLSTTSLPAVIDLTRRDGEERVLGNAPLDALRVVKSPGWYPDPAAANPGLQYSETVSPDAVLQPAAQIQPDNAFSHTTVTLSYVSRSHVFAAHDALSHSPLYSLQPISKFSLHPPRDTDKGLGDGGLALGPADLAVVETSVGLAVQTERPRANGEAASAGGRGDGGEGEPCPSKDEAFENGKGDSWSSSGVCADSSPETLTPVAGEEEEALFPASKGGGAGAGSEGAGAVELCPVGGEEYVSPLEDPVSPSAASLDDAEDRFALPQASCSPSGDPSFLGDAACDGSSTEGDAPPSSGEESTPRAGKRKASLEPLIDLTDDVCSSGVLESNGKNAAAHLNGNAKTLDKTLKERKLPARSGRGTRLEAIVMDINSSKYKVSGCVRSKKKPSASQTASSDSSLSSPRRRDALAASEPKGTDKAALPAKPPQRGQTNHSRDCKGSSTSDSELNSSKKSRSSPTPRSPPPAVHTRSKRDSPPVPPPRTSPLRPKRSPSSPNAKKEPEPLSASEPSEGTRSAKTPPPPKSPKKSQGKAKSNSPCGETSPAAKTKSQRTPKRRRKKPKPSCSPSMFSPKEPEIKLRYVNYKEEKRDPRLDGFSPFVRVERRQATPSLCTVVNYPEEVRAAPGGGQQQAQPGGFVPAAVPSTSCLRLGRVSARGPHQRPLVCCVCGRSANAMDLGDLHGPYYPEGHRPNAKAPAGASGLKEEEDESDSDSSSYSVRVRGRRRAAAPPAPRPLRPGAQLKPKALLAGGEGAGGPAAKRARSDGAPASAEDWYSAPVLPLDLCEYWLHEDCAIWSAGVFLVKGRVYGLEEAVKVARETVCSACHHPGATLGCFFKGCPSKYHYRCALESDCVLIEENFSMKCKKHKNKTFKGVPGQRLNVR